MLFNVLCVRFSPAAVPGMQPEAPAILQNLPEKVARYVDQELHLVVVAQGCGQLQYQWFRDGKKLPFGTSNELLVNGVGLGDQGVYNCRVTSDLGGSVLSGDSTVTGKCINNRLVHLYSKCHIGNRGIHFKLFSLFSVSCN